MVLREFYHCNYVLVTSIQEYFISNALDSITFTSRQVDKVVGVCEFHTVQC